MPNIVTYGQAKARFARAFGGGTLSTDPRVLEYANYATEAIMRELSGANPADGKPWTVRGVYVGGVDQLTLTVATGNLFTLDAAHDVALQVEMSTATDINNGWFSDLDLSGCVDPDFANDAIFIDQGLVNGNRAYSLPTASVGDTVKVMAKKRYAAIAGNDADVLLVPNVEAVCNMMIYLQKTGDRDNAEGGAIYFNRALASMKAELDGYLLDPTRSLARKSAYLSDEKTYPANTLGYVRARIALDLPAMLKVGKTQITRAINRAAERLVQRTNELRTTGRLSVKTGLELLVYTKAVNPTDVLPITDYEQIRTMVAGSLSPDAFAAAEERAYALLGAEEANRLETKRHQNYAAQLQTFIAANQVNTLGYFAYKLALDPEIPDGLKYSNYEWFRMLNDAVSEAIQHRNSLSATEIYSNVDGPDILVFTYRQNENDVLPYAEFQTIKMLVMAHLTPGQADVMRASAFAEIERDLAKAVKATRNAKWHCLLSLPRYTFGWMRGTIGLGLSEQGFQLSDQKLGRMINEVEESIAYTPNFVGGEGEYQLGCVGGMVEMPDDVDRVIYADICGQPLEIKHRSFEYIGWPQGNGVRSNCQYANGGWLWGAGYAMQDKGLSENGNRQYFVTGCIHGALRVIVRRRWMPKKKDGDVMLVQNLDAIRTRVEAKLARDAKDLASAGALESASDRAMDRQLENYVASETIMPRFSFPDRGRTRGRQLLRRF